MSEIDLRYAPGLPPGWHKSNPVAICDGEPAARMARDTLRWQGCCFVGGGENGCARPKPRKKTEKSWQRTWERSKEEEFSEK